MCVLDASPFASALAHGRLFILAFLWLSDLNRNEDSVYSANCGGSFRLATAVISCYIFYLGQHRSTIFALWVGHRHRDYRWEKTNCSVQNVGWLLPWTTVVTTILMRPMARTHIAAACRLPIWVQALTTASLVTNLLIISFKSWELASFPASLSFASDKIEQLHWHEEEHKQCRSRFSVSSPPAVSIFHCSNTKFSFPPFHIHSQSLTALQKLGEMSWLI